MIDVEKLRHLLKTMKGERPRCMKCGSTEAVAVNQIFGYVVSLCLVHRIEWDWQQEYENAAGEAVCVEMLWQATVALVSRTGEVNQDVHDLIAMRVNSEKSGRALLARFLGISAE